MFVNSSHHTNLLSLSLDSTLGVFDLRKNKLEALSDEIGYELNCMQVVKYGRNVVVGTDQGNMCVFNWNWFGDFKDQFTVCDSDVLCLDSLSADYVAFGDGDGNVGICTVHPNKVKGIIREKGKKDSLFTDID